MASTMYFVGLTAAMACAQSGILPTGVRSPHIMTNIITKKSITNVACCMVEELLEMMSPMPIMVRMKSPVKKRMFQRLPTGHRP